MFFFLLNIVEHQNAASLPMMVLIPVSLVALAFCAHFDIGVPSFSGRRYFLGSS